MPNPTPRTRFQIHLSTAVVMMFVAGSLILLQTLPKYGNGSSEFLNREWKYPSHAFSFNKAIDLPETGKVKLVEFDILNEDIIGRSDRKVVCFGWPFECVLKIEWWHYSGLDPKRDYFDLVEYWCAVGIIKNAIVAIFILGFVSFVCEWLIRRRTAQKEA